MLAGVEVSESAETLVSALAETPVFAGPALPETLGGKVDS